MGLTLTAIHGIPVCSRLISSAQNFKQCFRALNRANASASPVERLVFSLMLANAEPAQAQR